MFVVHAHLRALEKHGELKGGAGIVFSLKHLMLHVRTMALTLAALLRCLLPFFRAILEESVPASMRMIRPMVCELLLL